MADTFPWKLMVVFEGGQYGPFHSEKEAKEMKAKLGGGSFLLLPAETLEERKKREEVAAVMTQIADEPKMCPHGNINQRGWGRCSDCSD